MTNIENLLEIKDASFSYNEGKNIFEDLNLQVKKGEIFAILGANGCGKTTLIKCITGISKLSKGSINLNNENIASLKPSQIAKSMAYIPQEHNSTFPYSVLDVVLMGRSAHLEIFESPSEKDYKIAEKAIKNLNIEHLKDTPYNEISGGEQQLTFIARVLAQEPKLLVLDEPTSHLDFGNQIRALNVIEKLANDGLAIIMTSHFPDHVLMSGTKVAIMKDKGFIEVGSPKEVINSENMEKTYGVSVKIMDIGERFTCVPLKLK